MWGLDSLGVPANMADGTVAMPIWILGAFAALLVALVALAFLRKGAMTALAFAGVVCVAVLGAYAWMSTSRDNERRALEQRLLALDAAALAPGNVLACLDGTFGEAVESGCERSVFANPENVAAAASLTAARLTLLQDAAALSAHDPSFAHVLEGLRTGLELDRYGIVAHVLTLRYGCAAGGCDMLTMLRDSPKVRANMRGQVFEANVSRNQSAWRATPGIATAAATPSAPAAPSAPTLATVPSNVTFPSAASIPPISIMNSEPTTGSVPAAEPPAPVAATPTPTPAPRRSSTLRPPTDLVPAVRRP